MKQLTLLLSALAFAGSGFIASAETHGDPYRPVGTLNVKKNYERSGDHAELSWSISYPITASSLLAMNDYGQLVALEDVTIKVRVAGASVEHSAAAWISVDGGGWQQVFYGNPNQANPNKPVFEQTIPAGTTINLAARSRDKDGLWEEVRTTLGADSSVVVLANEDKVPSGVRAFEEGSLQDYLTTYFVAQNNNGHGNNEDGFDSSNQGSSTGVGGTTDSDPTVDDEIKLVHNAVLGPRELIYLFDLDSRLLEDSDFSLQDFAITVTVETIEETTAE